MNEVNLKKQLLQLPAKSGCYLFKNKDEKVIYVGKAQNLQKRISSYFQKTNYFREKIFDWEFFLTSNVKEALILEQNLIKQYQPRFNVLLKDDYYYPYIEITKGENPRYRLVKKVDLNRKSDYFGPFPNGSKAYEILHLLERLFPLAKCLGNLNKPCLHYMIGQCSGHCFQKISVDYYQQIKKQVIRFLQGKTQTVKKKLQTSLQKNLINLAFEIAQKQKKLLDSIELFTSEQNVEFADRNHRDFLGFYCQEKVITIVLLIYRFGRLLTIKQKTIPLLNEVEQEEILLSYLYQFYQKNLTPQFLYLPQTIENQELLTEQFVFTLNFPCHGQKKKILELAQQNAQQIWQNNFWNNFQQVNKKVTLEEMSKFLSIPFPYRIEALDISNLFHQDAVAGFLVFINGEKDINKSKFYKVDMNKLSDIERIKHACQLHYQKLAEKNLPNLIIVDGGQEQVKAVKSTLQNLKIPSLVVGLVKNEKHQTDSIINQNLKKVSLENNSQIKNFLTSLQEEVHNYTIKFHRKFHRQTIKNS